MNDRELEGMGYAGGIERLDEGVLGGGPLSGPPEYAQGAAGRELLTEHDGGLTPSNVAADIGGVAQAPPQRSRFEVGGGLAGAGALGGVGDFAGAAGHGAVANLAGAGGRGGGVGDFAGAAGHGAVANFAGVGGRGGGVGDFAGAGGRGAVGDLAEARGRRGADPVDPFWQMAAGGGPRAGTGGPGGGPGRLGAAGPWGEDFGAGAAEWWKKGWVESGERPDRALGDRGRMAEPGEFGGGERLGFPGAERSTQPLTAHPSVADLREQRFPRAVRPRTQEGIRSAGEGGRARGWQQDWLRRKEDRAGGEFAAAGQFRNTIKREDPPPAPEMRGRPGGRYTSTPAAGAGGPSFSRDPRLWTMGVDSDASEASWAGPGGERAVRRQRAGVARREEEGLEGLMASWGRLGTAERRRLGQVARSLADGEPARENGSSGGDQSTDSEGYDGGRGGRGRRWTRYSRPRREAAEENAVLAALRQLDHRTVPRPEEFDPDSGQSFDVFLELFEDYCRNSFRGDPALWVGELGRLLRGDIKRAFDAKRIPGMRYEAMTRELRIWMAHRHKDLARDAKHRFGTARMEPGESCSLFAARLEKLYRLAYPMKSPRTSDNLLDRYLDTCPEGLRAQILAAQSMMRALSGRELSWEELVAQASQFDVHAKRGRVGPPPPLSAAVGVSELPTYSSQWPLRGDPGTRPGGEGPAWCEYCTIWGHDWADCRTRQRLCHNCGTPGHMAARCPTRPGPSVVRGGGALASRGARDGPGQRVRHPTGQTPGGESGHPAGN